MMKQQVDRMMMKQHVDLDSMKDDPAVGFVCELLPSGDGYTWTLTSLLSRLLWLAEERYGPRDKTWTLLGIEFSKDGPQIWYPGNRGHVSVQLSLEATDQSDCAIWELAQEVPHLLSPTGKPNSATVFEEGICGVFARDIAARWRLNRFIGRPQGGHYGTAADLVQPLLEAHPDLVRQLRKRQPCISAINADLIVSVCAAVSGQLASALCRPFWEQ